jgi:ribonuclease Z
MCLHPQKKSPPASHFVLHHVVLVLHEIRRYTNPFRVAQVARDAGCEALILTHFSQRYPKVPVLDDVYHGLTSVAFDMMTVDIDTLKFAPTILAILRDYFQE